MSDEMPPGFRKGDPTGKEPVETEYATVTFVLSEWGPLPGETMSKPKINLEIESPGLKALRGDVFVGFEFHPVASAELEALWAEARDLVEKMNRLISDIRCTRFLG